MVLPPGTEAPDFEAEDQHGRMVHSNDLAGQRYVLFFYPKDQTMICTKEACAFQDALTDFNELGIPVLGVSFDSVRSHARFAEQHGLTYTLLADPEMKVIRAFDAKGLIGANRVTYLIGPEGIIEGTYRNRLAGKGHVDWVREQLERLGVVATA